MSTTPKPNADFDFLMGIWKCRHRYLVRRLADCHDWIEFDGSCAARKILDGFGNMDENDIELPGDRYRGMSLRTWDPELQALVDLLARQPPAGPPVPAGARQLREGRRHLLRRRHVRGPPHPRAVPVVAHHRQSARWEQAFSLDEGNSWETNWYMDFTRV